MDINEFRESVKVNISKIQNELKNKEIWIYGTEQEVLLYLMF